MNYKIYTTCAALAPYVKSYWSLDGSGGNLRERIFPDGCIELVFHFGDLFQKYRSGHGADVQPRGFIHGQLKQFMEVGPTGSTGIFSARFHPGGMRAFTTTDLDELTGDYITTSDFWGQAGRILEDTILHAASHEQRVVLLEDFLLKRLAVTPTYNKAVDHCIGAIGQAHGNVTVDALAAMGNMSRRHLERRITAAVGIGPKLLARIARFQHILSLIERGRAGNFSQVAQDGGFYDQAHFIKDFKEFTGLNPRQYFSENLTLVKFFSFDE
jgi:AraC-like DNA-binding protein